MSIIVYAGLAVVALTGIFLLSRVLSRRASRAAPDLPDPELAGIEETDSSPTVSDAPPTPMPPESYDARLKGDLRLDGKSVFPGGAFVEGSLTIEKAGFVEGPVEVTGDVILQEGARLTHPLVVHGNLVLGPAASVRSTLVGGRVTLYREAVVEGNLECDSLHLRETDRMQEPVAPGTGAHSVHVQPVS